LEQQQHESVRNFGSRGNGHRSYKGDSNCSDQRIMGMGNWRCLCIDDNSFNCGWGVWGLVQAWGECRSVDELRSFAVVAVTWSGQRLWRHSCWMQGF
jgi:hypothetical protein